MQCFQSVLKLDLIQHSVLNFLLGLRFVNNMTDHTVTPQTSMLK